MNRPSIDHGLLSPSGRMSKRARKAAMARAAKGLFPSGFWEEARRVPQPTRREALLQQAARLRDLADRGVNTRRYNREADKLEARAANLDITERDLKL